MWSQQCLGNSFPRLGWDIKLWRRIVATPLSLKWEHFSWSQDRKTPLWETGSLVSGEPDKSMPLFYGTPLAIILETNIFFLTVSPSRPGQPWIASRDFLFHSGVRTVFLDIMKLMKSKQNLSFSLTISAWECNGGFSRPGGKVFRVSRNFLAPTPFLSVVPTFRVWDRGRKNYRRKNSFISAGAVFKFFSSVQKWLCLSGRLCGPLATFPSPPTPNRGSAQAPTQVMSPPVCLSAEGATEQAAGQGPFMVPSCLPSQGIEEKVTPAPAIFPPSDLSRPLSLWPPNMGVGTSPGLLLRSSCCIWIGWAFAVAQRASSQVEMSSSLFIRNPPPHLSLGFRVWKDSSTSRGGKWGRSSAALGELFPRSLGPPLGTYWGWSSWELFGHPWDVSMLLFRTWGNITPYSQLQDFGQNSGQQENSSLL